MASAQGLCWVQWTSVCSILNPAPSCTMIYFSDFYVILLQLPHVALAKWPALTGMQTSAARSMSVVCFPPWPFLPGSNRSPSAGEQWALQGTGCAKGGGNGPTGFPTKWKD